MSRAFLHSVLAVLLVGTSISCGRSTSLDVIAVEVRTTGASDGSTERRWYAEDRGRYDTSDGMIHIVRLDRGEVWILDPVKRECVQCPLDELIYEMKQVDAQLVLDARNSIEWRPHVAELQRVLKGDYKVQAMPHRTTAKGYDCLTLGRSQGYVLRITSQIADDRRLPGSALEIDLAMAALGGASRGYGSLLYEWRKVSRAYGNLAVSTRVHVRLPGMRNPATSESGLVRVETEEVESDFFEIPLGYEVRRWSE